MVAGVSGSWEVLAGHECTYIHEYIHNAEVPSMGGLMGNINTGYEKSAYFFGRIFGLGESQGGQVGPGLWSRIAQHLYVTGSSH